MGALSISPGYILTFALSFGILFVVLRAWVYKPLLQMLEQRRVAIARGLEDARIAAEARANAEREANRIISEAQTRAAEIMREANDRAGSAEKDVRAQAEVEAAHAREQVKVELESERNRMFSEVRAQIVTLAIAAARKLLNENLDEKRQRALVNDFFSGIQDGRLTLQIPANQQQPLSAEVISALPLTGEEEATIQRELSECAGVQIAVRFCVDPSILGGLVLRLDDQVVDGSLAGQLENLHQNLR